MVESEGTSQQTATGGGADRRMSALESDSQLAMQPINKNWNEQ